MPYLGPTPPEPPEASLDLAELVTAGLIEKAGSTGKGVYYTLAKGAMIQFMEGGNRGAIGAIAYSGIQDSKGAIYGPFGPWIGSQGTHRKTRHEPVKSATKWDLMGTKGTPRPMSL
jgi:hypothetical protein